MIKPTFLIKQNDLNYIKQINVDDLNKNSYSDLVLYCTDLPGCFSFHSDENKGTLKVYLRDDEDRRKFFQVGILIHDRINDKLSINSPFPMFEGTMKDAYECSMKLSIMMQEKDLDSLYGDLGLDEAVIVLRKNNGLIWEVVSDIACPILEDSDDDCYMDNLVEDNFDDEDNTDNMYLDNVIVNAEMGNIESMRELVMIYMSGDENLGVEVDHEKALYWLKKIEEASDDDFDEDNLSESELNDIINEAEAGDISAMEQLAMLYVNGDEAIGVEANPEKVAYWFRKAAEAGDEMDMFNLGHLYAKGYGVERDFLKAVEWMNKAVDAGYDDAREALEFYSNLADALEKAKQGDVQAQVVLADGFMQLASGLGHLGAEADYYESVKWASKAAEQNNADAMWTLALAYEHGRGVEKDVNQAIEYYEKGAELGNAACQHNLGCYYATGDYLEKDEKKAFELFQKSAAQGYGLAMSSLGRCYQFAIGCVGNMKTALDWYIKACEVLDDPELYMRVMAFQNLSEINPNWDEDYSDDEE